MGRSISDRSTKNGEALRRFAQFFLPVARSNTEHRRFADMQNSWNTLQRQIQQLDAKVRLLTDQNHASLLSAAGVVEILGEQFSPNALSPNDFPPEPKADKRNGKNRISSAGSGVTSLSTSQLSQDPHKTPKTMRFPTHGSQYSQPVSPTPSSPSTTSSIASRPNAVGSRIPVISPQRKSATHRLMDVPGLFMSTSHGQPFLSEASTSTYNQNRLNHASEMARTPEPRSSLPRTAYQPMSGMSPTVGYRSFSLGVTPQTAPISRKSSSRAPPSSFRARSPTPGGASTRPASRLSMVSYSNVDTSSLKPFRPSKYDLLDQHVQAIIEEIAVGFFVARVDPPLRKGQTKRDDEEWKGNYVFGAGEKPVAVKLLDEQALAVGRDLGRSVWSGWVEHGRLWPAC